MRLSILAFVAGVCALQCVPRWPFTVLAPSVFAPLALCGLGALACLLRARPGPVAFFAGVLWAGWHAQLGLAARLPDALDGAAFAVRGDVVDLPAAIDGTRRFELSLAATRRGAHAGPGLRRVALADYGTGLEVAAGDRCRLYVRLRTPRGTHNPAGTDYERWLFARRIDATGYVIAHPANHCVPRPVRGALGRMRAALVAALVAHVTDGASAGVLRALTVGERAALGERQWQVLQATGTAHLVSISGLHVSMVAVAVYALARGAFSLWPRLTRRMPAPALGAGCGLLAAAAYAMLAGFTVPTQRTLLMLVCLWWQRRRGQGLLNTDGLVVALGVVVLADPLAVLTASCWLSFGAMAALVAASALLRDLSTVPRTLGLHLSLAVALAPLLALVSPLLAWTSPLANLFAVPLATWGVVPLALLGAALQLAGLPGAAVCWQLAARVWAVTWCGLELLADTAPAWHLPYAMPLAGVPLVLLGLLFAVLPLGRARWGLALLLCLGPWLAAPPAIGQGSVRVTVYDVGQGLSVLVRTRRHALLYDAGPRSRGGRDAGKSVVVPNLRAAGVWQLDRLVLSHPDVDHAGGAVAVLAGIEVAEVTVNPRDPWRGPATRCVAGQSWQWDGVRFDFLHPQPDTAGDDNHLSCVLRVTSAAGRRVLLTGDIDIAAEDELVAEPEAVAADILVSPHHGSATSSSPGFVAAVAAREVIHSAAHGNRYGFPAAAVVARYAAREARQHVTGDHGAIVIDLRSDATTVTHWRDIAQRYWHVP